MNLFILGYSGHAFVVIDVAYSNNMLVKGYFDNKVAEKNPYSISFFGSERENTFKNIVGNAYIFPAIGCNTLREKVTDFIASNSLKTILLVDSSAYVSNTARIENSSLVAPRAVVNSLAQIGVGCIINSGSIVEHDCELQNYVHLAPGAVLAGNVKVGEKTFIGANAVVKEGVSIGKNVIIGAGAVVLKNVPDGETWVGNPAKKIR